MKIAMLSTFYPFRGGIAQFNGLVFRELEKEHEVKAFNFKRQYPNFLFPGETQYVTAEDKADAIPTVDCLDSVNPLSYLSTAKKIKKFNPDILITRYWMTFFAPSLGAVTKRMPKHTKRISILDNVIPHEKRFFDAPANRFFLKHNDGFVVMSDTVLADLLSIRPEAKYLRINHPVYDQFGERMTREDALKELNLDSSRNYLLFFGFIRDYKGLDLLIEALTYLDESYHLIVAGEVYGSFEKYEKQINQFQLKERIHLFNHYISDDKVSAFFSASDVCVLPYKGATQSGITAISHHFELPIIATDVGGLKETTHHGKTGLIVEKPDSKLIAASISTYYEENYNVSFSQNIAEEKLENSWENFAKKLIEFAQTI